MRDVLVILQSPIAERDREAIVSLAPLKQAISSRVFIAAVADVALTRLQTLPGVAHVLTGGEAVDALPALDAAETLFVQAWLSSRGKKIARRGDGLDWDTPGMLPPDTKH